MRSGLGFSCELRRGTLLCGRVDCVRQHLVCMCFMSNLDPLSFVYEDAGVIGFLLQSYWGRYYHDEKGQRASVISLEPGIPGTFGCGRSSTKSHVASGMLRCFTWKLEARSSYHASEA